jgi:hypothetical protein
VKVVSTPYTMPFAQSNAPVRPVKEIQFGILSPEDIVSRGLCIMESFGLSVDPVYVLMFQ